MEVKWWNKFDATQMIQDLTLPDMTQEEEVTSSSNSKRKIKEVLKGLSTSEVLAYLHFREDFDNEDNASDSDPFGGPLV